MLKPEEIVAVFIALCFVIQLVYHWLVFARLAFYKSKSEPTNTRPVSVVIVARNEYYNLIKTLESILDQDYPEFEVIVVNDNSDDDTVFYLKEVAKSHSNLKVIQIDHSVNFFSGKKFPLSIGIKSASYDSILLTDADCTVPSKNWITNMQNTFQDKTQIVLGYGPYQPAKGILNKLIRFDAFMVALHYLSFSILRMPYMGVGRNMAYSKIMFYEKKGFISHYKINSGDDDLFINQAANKINTEICIEPDSFTYSIPEKKFGDWLIQKKRHLSTSNLYKSKHKLFLMAYPLSLFFFYALSITFVILNGFILNAWLIVVLSLFAVRTISFFLIQKSALQKLKERKLLLLSPILELLMYALQGLVMAWNIFNRKNKWK